MRQITDMTVQQMKVFSMHDMEPGEPHSCELLSGISTAYCGILLRGEKSSKGVIAL